MKRSLQHWFHAGLTFLFTILGGGTVLSLVRLQPKSAHEFITSLSNWLRIGLIFCLCTLFAYTMFKLLSPRLTHLRYYKTHPPGWLAALLGVIVVAVVDVLGGLTPNGYRATPWEWLGYAGISSLIVGWCLGTWRDITSLWSGKERPKSEESQPPRLQNIATAPWTDIEEWLRSDAPAYYDFLGNHSAAGRLEAMLIGGARSVGVVGPFGAGKTSLVNWVAEKIRRSTPYCVCSHSCWGFESSSSAIHDMLAAAVAQLGTEIDTFHIDSLPESYRQTFSAGGKWIDTIASLVLGRRDLPGQFERLSDLLGIMNARLIFIVEDLDRNETQTFDIQDVLAFLERLKSYRNFSFVLTGGLSSTRRIDFAKLCDHIEHLPSIHPHHASALVLRLRERCLDLAVFPHEPIGTPDRRYEWNSLSGLLTRDHEELALPQAVASLLNTPRSLRHALGRTFSAWRRLCGEIDFDHLLAVNVLRFGAPECFLFLLRRWDRLHATPSQNTSLGSGQTEHIRQAVRDDWNQTIQEVDWRPAAALKVLESILPASAYWLGTDTSTSGLPIERPQGVEQESYWLRVVNEAIAGDDVRDQEALQDIRAWTESPCVDANLITKLTTPCARNEFWDDSTYNNVCERLAKHRFAGQVDNALLLGEHVLTKILRLHGPAASDDCQGFVHAWRIASHLVPPRSENRTWLEARICEAAAVSLEAVNGLWRLYGNRGQFSTLSPEDEPPVRAYIVSLLAQVITDGDSLAAKLSPQSTSTLYRLVFATDDGSPATAGDVSAWRWLGPIILDALRNRNAVVATNCAVLLIARVSARDQATVDQEVLAAFFGDTGSEVIQILDEMSMQVSESERTLVRNVVKAASQVLEGTTPGIEKSAVADTNDDSTST
jgi:hypothetical protein